MAGERAAQAQTRAREAAQRVMQLRERMQRLRAGRPPTIADVRRSDEAAEQAAVYAAHARQCAAAAYRRAAEAHRGAAHAMESDGDFTGAERHREQAVNDDLAADAELFRG